jgi:asparagine synthetase B (glutamine-hydrolysing)
MLRSIITNHLKDKIEFPDSVAVLCSGGMDSLSVILSCLDLGISPTLYTFYLKSFPSKDLESSQYISKLFNLKLTEIAIYDNNLDILQQDVLNIIKRFDVKKKTAIQCIYPFLYVAPAVEEKVILTGLCADDLYGTPRSMAKHASNIEFFNELRNGKVQNPNASSYLQIKTLFESYGKQFIAPYKESEPLIGFLSSMSYREMNSPKQKLPAYQAYEKELTTHQLYRRNSNLQCGSMIREWHDKLLLSEHNTIGANTIIALYNHWHRENNEI